MQVRAASRAAPGRCENEDIAVHHGDLVGVLDGVTAPEGFETGCRHSPGWYVRRLSDRLGRTSAENPTSSLADVLAAAIAMVREDHGGGCDLGNPASPAATVCLARPTADGLEYLVLSDTTLVVDRGSNVRTVTDTRFAAVIGELNAAFPPPGVHDSGFAAWRHAYFARKYQLTNQDGGYWLASTSSDAAYRAVSGSFPLGEPAGVRYAALLTDGASCAVDLFGLMDWPSLLDVLRSQGPDELIRRVRAAEDEHSHATGTRKRWKRRDDATVVWCDFSLEG
jgi:hypothetical protein